MNELKNHYRIVYIKIQGRDYKQDAATNEIRIL